jgi:hypothetical protein
MIFFLAKGFYLYFLCEKQFKYTTINLGVVWGGGELWMQLTPFKFKIVAYLNHVPNLRTANLVSNQGLVPCAHYTFPSMLSNV